MRLAEISSKVKWDGDTYTLVQNGVKSPLTEIDNCCFTPVNCPVASLNSVEIHPHVLHERFGHVALWAIERTIQVGAVLDSPGVRKLKQDVCCKTCATTNATRNAVSLPSRDICNEPGEVIAADVIGPYKKSVEGHQYILTIQDLSSGMVLAIPLRTQGKSTKEIDITPIERVVRRKTSMGMLRCGCTGVKILGRSSQQRCRHGSHGGARPSWIGLPVWKWRSKWPCLSITGCMWRMSHQRTRNGCCDFVGCLGRSRLCKAL
ncbi:uncharacterized protein VP01_7g13 [Puccinia sorghi]|uniref:Integrase catalytic domain-containing protein n=1 Tax=Puccinia sorghi TaxID=27349 RepID=A0A0L6UAI8_9BASI|nr:uncharacterized protein VP01_7g13 [Puccinia sorghi]